MHFKNKMVDSSKKGLTILEIIRRSIFHEKGARMGRKVHRWRFQTSTESNILRSFQRARFCNTGWCQNWKSEGLKISSNMFQRKFVQWQMMSSLSLWKLKLNVTSFFFRFQNLHFTLCKGISWQVNLSRLDFPWILRWCYFTSLSRACILNFLSSVFALWSHLLYPPMSNTACYCKIVKSNTASPPLSFSSESCSAANSTKLCSAPAEKSRKETEGNPYWMVLASNSMISSHQASWSPPTNSS